MSGLRLLLIILCIVFFIFAIVGFSILHLASLAVALLLWFILWVWFRG